MARTSRRSPSTPLRAGRPTRPGPAAASLASVDDVQVALLRGVNVGGKNRVPMADLAAAFTAAGCRDVRTYIQSGNVVFRAPASDDGALAALLQQAIGRRFALEVPVVLRSAAALAAVAAGNPFLAAGADLERLHVAFLARPPAPERAAALDPGRSPPDELALRGADLYLHLPNGMGRTRYTSDYLDRALGTTTTARNWRTVLALRDLAVSL